MLLTHCNTLWQHNRLIIYWGYIYPITKQICIIVLVCHGEWSCFGCRFVGVFGYTHNNVYKLFLCHYHFSIVHGTNMYFHRGLILLIMWTSQMNIVYDIVCCIPTYHLPSNIKTQSSTSMWSTHLKWFQKDYFGAFEALHASVKLN